MVINKISLNRDINPEYYKLLDEYNVLLDRWNRCNIKIHCFKVPRIFLMKTKKKIVEIGKVAEALQKDFLDWNKRASNFFLQPNYKINPEQNGALVFTHFTDNMRYSVNYLNNLMILLVDNYNKVYTAYENQLNFGIAVLSFFISMIGLLFSLSILFLAENSSDVLKHPETARKVEIIESKTDSLSLHAGSIIKADSLRSESFFSKEKDTLFLNKEK